MCDFTLTEHEREFAERHHDLIYKVADKYGVDLDEHYGDMAIGLCLAAKVQNDTKIKFGLDNFEEIATLFMAIECSRPNKCPNCYY